MTVSRTPAPEDYGPASLAADRATDWPPPYSLTAIPFADRALWVRVISNARCTGSSLDPDEWFPVSAEMDKARHEAAAAIAVCTTCLVRAECLALSLRHWDIGQHGVWGGLVAAERAALRAVGTRPCSALPRPAALADSANPDAARRTRQRAGRGKGRRST